MVFTMGIVVSLVTQLCTVPYLKDKSSNMTVYYNMILGIVTILFTTYGCFSLFQKSAINNIGSLDEGIGLILAIITFPLLALETVLIAVIFHTKSLSNMLGAFLLVWWSEKIIQVIFYIFVRKCKPIPEYKDGAVFYFSFLSFINFTMWLNCIPFTDIKLYDEVSQDDYFWLVDRTFKALLIDYRLLCSILFLEHAVDLSDSCHRENHAEQSEVDQRFQPPRNRWLYTMLGIGLGLLSCFLEVINGLQFWHDLSVIVNVGPIIVDVILMVSGLLLLHHAGDGTSLRRKHDAVKMMVASMGAVSIVYLIILGLLCSVWVANQIGGNINDHHAYVVWSAAVFMLRGVSLLILLVVYIGVPFSTMESKDNHRNNWNYSLTLGLFLGLFARFVGSVLYEFHGTIHKLLRDNLESQHLRSLKDLFDIGPLFHLATCLHLALHFLLMVLRLHKPPRKVPENHSYTQGSSISRNRGRDGLSVPQDDRYFSKETTPLLART